MEQLSIADLAAGKSLIADSFAPAVAVVDLDGVDWSDQELLSAAAQTLASGSIVTLGVSSTLLPDSAAPVLEGLTCTLAPGGPGRTWVDFGDAEQLVENILRNPLAAQCVARLLVTTSRVSVADALQAESLTYSMLLAGPEFATWLAGQGPRGERPDGEVVDIGRDGDQLTVTLNQPERHNAFGAAMRDGVVDALDIARHDSRIHTVVLRGAGASFSSGGDLTEFGTTPDPVVGHLVRTARSAGWAIHELGERIRVELHGACIGAGIEVPSFAGQIRAEPGTWFLLPELSMGLIPGAGGTVGITRRIGRWRTAYMVLSGQRIDLATAHAWGLVDDIG